MNFDKLYNELFETKDQINCNIQYGGYEELTNNKIIELWQNPDFNDKFINYYTKVNKYLRGIKIDINEETLKILKLNSIKDFYDFMNYYINKLTNIIYKNPSIEKQIFFRGENRKNFNYEIGDVIFYSTFQSVSSSISTAFKFSRGSKNSSKLLFVIEIPKNFYYKMLTTKLKLYNLKNNVTEYIDEKEYLIIPNTYYVIVDKYIIYGNTNVIKLRLFYQDYYQIYNNVLYQEKNILPKHNDYKNFNSKELNNFIILSKKYQKTIDFLNSLNSYKINIKYYEELEKVNSDDLFNIDIEKINNKLALINQYNFKEIAEEIKKLGIGYYESELKNMIKYKERIGRINLLLKTNFNYISKITVYAGYYNYDRTFKIPEFIKIIKSKNVNEFFEYNKILRTNYTIDNFLYSDIFNKDSPNNKIKKNTKTSLLYYKYIIQFNVLNTKICVCDVHEYKNNDNIILIPNFKMEIKNIKNMINKYNLKYIYYEINLHNY